MNSPSKRIAPSSTPPRCTFREFDHKERLRCRFCGGERCIRCGREAYKQCTDPAIDRFHCNWITQELLAMQRPSDELFDSIMLIEALQCHGITTVINLCEPGEHPYCGYPLKSSGFPYSPERLMASGIKYFNFYWPDMTAPSFTTAHNTIRVILTEVLKGGKVAVHCHAGFGRTGIVVACVALVLQQLPASEAIALVRCKRPGSIQTSTQKAFIAKYHDFHQKQSVIFPLSSTKDNAKSLMQSISDELLSPPLHLVMKSDGYALLCSEYLPNAIRLSALILIHLFPRVGRIGLSLALARLSLSPAGNVHIDRAISLSTVLDSLENGRLSPVRTFLANRPLKANSEGCMLNCRPSEEAVLSYKKLANAGKWKEWFSSPHLNLLSGDNTNTVSLNSDDEVFEEKFNSLHINVDKLLSFASAGSEDASGDLHTADDNNHDDSNNNDHNKNNQIKDNNDNNNDNNGDNNNDNNNNDNSNDNNLEHDSDNNTNDISSNVNNNNRNNDNNYDDSGSNGIYNNDSAEEGSENMATLYSLLACHGSLLLDWFDTRSDALFDSSLLSELQSSLIEQYGPYVCPRRGPSNEQSELQSESDVEGKLASGLTDLLHRHLSKRKLQMLEVLTSVLSMLLTDQDNRANSSSQPSNSEVSIYLVCAEIRVALSVYHHFSALPELLDRHGPESNVNGSDASSAQDSELILDATQCQSLHDVINIVNTLRFLSVHKWSASKHELYPSATVGTECMRPSMAKAKLKSVHWNERNVQLSS